MIERKEIPGISLSEIKEDYAKFLSCGYDTIQESFNVTITAEWAEKLYNLRYQAEKSKEKVSFRLSEEFQMNQSGSKGFCYCIGNDDLLFLIRNPEGNVPDWQVTVRYLSAGLWEHGYHTLKDRVLTVLKELCYEPNSEDWQRITRCDFCFDFYSPDFAAEMTPEICRGIVGTNKTKQQICGNTFFEETATGFSGWMKAGRVETLTIGSRGSLQVSVYDKTREITEASGKTWFYKIWGHKYEKDVYRVEIRMCREWLKDRNIRTMEEIEENREYLINEALIRRRLAVPCNDSNRSRWKLHPLWTLCYKINGSQIEVVKVGRQLTCKKEYLEKISISSIAGSIRSLVILKGGEWDDESYIVAMQDINNQIFNDPQRKLKERKAQERYKFIGEAA